MDGSGQPLVLVVDDEKPIVELISRYLAAEHFRVEIAGEGQTALDLARTSQPDVIVLDLMLPGTNGVEVCRQVRSFSDAYIIMLTARAEEVDKLIGLAVGADDYMTKPFSPRELIARIHALLRRPRRDQAREHEEQDDWPDALRFDDLIIDTRAHEVRRNGELIELTPIEFKLLSILSDQPRRVFTRDLLLELGWGADFFGDDRVVDTHISNLRHKIERDPANPTFIHTVRGLGYRWDPEPS
ncbi:MAG: response regulator transcription factor [Thermomicrobiales bacterium]